MRRLSVLTGLMLLASTVASTLPAVRLELLADGRAESPGDGFGHSVAAVDLNRDGFDDLAVGAPHNGSSGRDAGAVFIFYGSPRLSPGALSPARADVVLRGMQNDSLFGECLANAGDVNNDSREDLLVGAPGFNGGRGAAYLFFGGGLRNVTAELANATFIGLKSASGLGSSLSAAGDVNGDGIDDFIVGNPGGSWNGEARVYYGRPVSGQTHYPDLGELPADRPQPVDFTSGIYSIGNTYYLAGADDGWDWQAGVFGGTDPNVQFFPPDGGSGRTLHVRAGGGSSGNGPGNNNVPASGGYGLEFSVTPEMHQAIRNGASALLAFEWELWDETGLESWDGELGWVKACFSNSSGRYYLGSNLDRDSSPGDDDQAGSWSDATPELYFYDWADSNPRQLSGSFHADVSSYITYPGYYYLDMGIKLGDWSVSGEYLHGYFDNLSLFISHFGLPGATLPSPGSPRFGSEVAGAGDLNGDGYDDLLVGGGDDRAFVYYGGSRLADNFEPRRANITPSSQNASDTSGEPLSSINTDDDIYYRVGQNEVMYFDGFGTSGMNGTLQEANLYCTYQVRPGGFFTGSNRLRFALPPAKLATTNIQPAPTFAEVLGGPFDLVGAGVIGLDALTALQVEYTNNDGGPRDDWVDFDIIYIAVTWSPFPNITLVGTAGSQFGSSLAGAGDLDGDSCDDIVVGAPEAGGGRGAAFIFVGGPRLGRNLSESDSRAKLIGLAAGDRFGGALAAGMVSLDGLPDLVVGAPGAGKAYLFNGTASIHDAGAGSADDSISGDPTSRFGEAVAAGDANGLGRAEVLIGESLFNGSGRASLFGNRDEWILSLPLNISYLPASDPTIREMENQSFGFTVNNPTEELGTRPQWFLDRALMTDEAALNYTYFSNYTSSGEHNVTVRITDGIRQASHSWRLHVIDVNAPPTVSWQPPGEAVTVDEGTSLTLLAEAYDVDRDPLTFRWGLEGEDLGINRSSYLFQTGYESAGTYRFSCSVDDGRGHRLAHNWTVVVGNLNRAPAIEIWMPQSADVMVREGETLLFNITAQDPDGDSIAVMWYLGPKMVAVDAFSFLFQPDYRSAGFKVVRVAVSDGELTSSRTWNLTILDINAPPVIDAFLPAGNVVVDEGMKAAFWLSAHDPDGDPLSISWLVDSELKASGEFAFSFQSSPDSQGSYGIQALLSDGTNTVVRTWTLKVNHAPRITTWNPIENLTYLQFGKEAFFFITPVDADNDPLFISWFLDGRYEAGVQGNSARFSVDLSTSGSFRMKVVASDGRLSDAHEWTLVVNRTSDQAPVPVIDLTPPNPRAGQEVGLSGKGSSDDRQIINFTWDFGDGHLGHGMNVAHTYYEAGAYEIRLTVTDTEGNRATSTAVLAVAPIPDSVKAEPDRGPMVFALVVILLAIAVAVALFQWRVLRRLEER